MNVLPSGKFKEKKRKQSHDSQSGPKTKKKKRQREDSNEISESPSSESSVCETGHKTSEMRSPVAKLGLPASTLMFKKPLRTSVTINNSQRRGAPLPLYLHVTRVLKYTSTVTAKEFIDIDICSFGRNSDSDMWTFRNCDVERFETQTGDIKNPLTGPRWKTQKQKNWLPGHKILGINFITIINLQIQSIKTCV